MERRINLDAKLGHKSGSKLKQVASLIKELSYTDMKAFSKAFDATKASCVTGTFTTPDILLETADAILQDGIEYRDNQGVLVK